MRSPSSRRLRLPRCQPAACTAPEEAAQRPRPPLGANPFPATPLPGRRGEGSDGWDGWGEPARLRLLLTASCAEQPTSGRGEPQKCPPLPEPGPAGLKSPSEALPPVGRSPGLSCALCALGLGWGHGGQIAPRDPRLPSHPHDGVSKQPKSAGRCTAAGVLPPRPCPGAVTKQPTWRGGTQAPFAHATTACRTGPTSAGALHGQTCSFLINLQRNVSPFGANPIGISLSREDAGSGRVPGSIPAHPVPRRAPGEQ